MIKKYFYLFSLIITLSSCSGYQYKKQILNSARKSNKNAMSIQRIDNSQSSSKDVLLELNQ